MTFYIVGAKGRLAQALVSEYADHEVVKLERSIYERWSRPAACSLVSQYFGEHLDRDDTIFVVSGLLDPTLPEADLLNVNFHLPKNIIDAAANLGIRVITFGTVMERLLTSQNRYVHSKALLGEYVDAMAAEGAPALHLQLHTLYGIGQPSRFMFLGQMLTAIENREQFGMTSGRQLREYHHLTDEAKAIRQIAAATHSGVFNLSHGKPLRLHQIAEFVFAAVGKPELLLIGARPDPPEENYAAVLQPASPLLQMEFRDSLPAILKYLKECHLRREYDAEI